METLLNLVENWVDRQMPNVIEDLKRICRIRSVAKTNETECPPFGKGCFDVLNEMLQMGREEGFETYNYDNYVGRITYPGKTKDNIGIWAHLDVVEERDNWTYAPYEPTVKNGYFIARGCQDNKSSAIVGLYALKYFKAHGFLPKHTIELYLGTCEEKGMYDIDYFLEHYQAPKLSLVPDSAFPVCCGERGSFNGELVQNDKCSEDVLAIECHCDLYTIPECVELTLRATDTIKEKCKAAKGDVLGEDIRIVYSEDGSQIVITARGISSQSMHPFNGRSALVTMAEFVCEHEVLGKTESQAFAFVKEINTGFNGKALDVNCEDAISGAMIMVATRMRLLDKHFVIDFVSKYPVTCNDFPYQENAEKVAEEKGYTLNITRLSKANWFDPEKSEARALTEVSNLVLGREDKPFVMSGGTYARKLPNAMAWGTGMLLPPRPEDMFWPGHGDFHQPDESIALERIRKGLIIYILGLMKIDK